MGVLFLIFGLIIGSFLNVCIFRIPKEESIAYPPSHCTSCGYELKPKDLIPIFSYLFLKGRCRSCGDRISIRYPIIEGINGLCYLLIYSKYGISIDGIFFCILASLLIVISMIDFDTKEVYRSTTVFGFILGIIYIGISGFYSHVNYMDNILGGIIGFLIIFLIVKLTKAMGEGDYEISAICGLFLGWKGIILGLFLAIVIGGIYGSIILASKSKGRKDEMAFGPFIAIGSFISMLYFAEIMKIYLGIFIGI